MAKHRNYDLIVKWATDPERYCVKCRASEAERWEGWHAGALLNEELQVRLVERVRMMHLNGMEFPAPETEAPAEDAQYFIPHMSDGVENRLYCVWGGSGYEYRRLRAGLVHLREEAALAHARAMLNAKEVE